jgi:hypothetical protein
MADVDVTDAMGRTAVRGAMRETASGVDPEAAPDAARAGEPEVERRNFKRAFAIAPRTPVPPRGTTIATRHAHVRRAWVGVSISSLTFSAGCPTTLRVVDVALKGRVPAVFGLSILVEAGGFMSYGPNRAELWHKAALLTDKILRGAKPGDLPVEQPTKFELVVNLKTARTLGLTIPQTLLLRADQVIE